MAKKGKTNSKTLGNNYERKVAKQLSGWIFDDPYLLRKKGDSGTTKYNYCGDIFPEGQLPEKWRGHFPFMIECKWGYEKNYPDFWSYAKTKDWMEKARKEGCINNQFITLLIVQFKYKKAFYITDYFLNPNKIIFNVCFPFRGESGISWAYVYFLNDVLGKNFYNLYSLENIIC